MTLETHSPAIAQPIKVIPAASPKLQLKDDASEAEQHDVQDLAETGVAFAEISTGSSMMDLVPSVAQPDRPRVIPIETTVEKSSRLVLRLGERRVYLFRGDRNVASYPVAVGKAGWETPQGQFEVMQKIPDPVWKHPWNGNLVGPGPSNPLGRRWIGFARDGNNWIGFHGTIDESLIGQAVSHGCVRMRNADVEALFEQIELGTTVVVQP